MLNTTTPTTKLKADVTVNKEKLQIVMVRVFDAPRTLVYRVITDPKLVPQWWGPRNLTTVVDKMDVKPGGAWRYVQRDPAGEEFAFRGEYREIVPNERVVQTFEFEPMAGHIILETMTLEEVDSRTKLTNISQFDSLADLEGMLASGMEGGADEGYDRLAEVLAASK